MPCFVFATRRICWKRHPSDLPSLLQLAGKPDIAAFWLALNDEQRTSLLTLEHSHLTALISEAETADDKQGELLQDSRFGLAADLA